MKRFITFILLFSVLGASALLSSCGNKGDATEFGFYDSRNDVEYIYSPPNKLYPITPEKEEEYLTVENEDGTSTVFYKVAFEDPRDFLCYEIEGFYFLAQNKEMEEMTIMDFNPIAASIYNETNLLSMGSFYADNEYLPDEKKEHSPTEDTWICQLIAKQILEGEAVNFVANPDNISNVYHLRMYSQDYPGVYYLITFFEYNGRHFLEDKSANKIVYCPNDVVSRLVGN